jgi:hypothetical protein
MHLLVDPRGHVHCLYDERLDLSCLGSLHIARASSVEPDAEGQWHADLSPVGGPKLGPYRQRSEALDAERAWLEEHYLAGTAAALSS